MSKWKTTCEYGNHIIDQHHEILHVYTDKKNGIEKDTLTCDRCMLEHARKYYPDGAIEHEILRNHPEWMDMKGSR